MLPSRSQSGLVSIAIQTGAVVVLWFVSDRIAPTPSRLTRVSLAPLPAPYLPNPSLPRPKLNASQSMGGGGGMRQTLPATAGHLPKIAPRQFVPPTPVIPQMQPKLAMEMTIEAPPEAALLDRPIAGLGDPLSKFMNGSAGKGGPLGIGNGPGTGVGDKRGPGAGDGDGLAGMVYRTGDGVTRPVLIHEVEPEFSEEARKAKYSGTVKLHADIDATGHPRNIRIIRSLGMGLDERAVNAVEKWLFKPGTKDGKPVAVEAFVEVSFHLL